MPSSVHDARGIARTIEGGNDSDRDHDVRREITSDGGDGREIRHDVIRERTSDGGDDREREHGQKRERAIGGGNNSCDSPTRWTIWTISRSVIDGFDRQLLTSGYTVSIRPCTNILIIPM